MKETVFAFLETLNKTQFMPPAAMQAHQRELLEPLVRHAHANVPFYRDSGRLAPLFRNDGSIDWDAWPRIPLLTRSEVRAAGNALRSPELPSHHGGTQVLSTSGSTGEPVQVAHSQLAGDLVWPALMLRALNWYGLDPTSRFARVGTFPREKPPLSTPRHRKGWVVQFELMEIFGPRLDLPESLGLPTILEHLIEFRPNCLSINPVELELLTGWDKDRRLRSLGPIVIMTSADRLMDSTRDVIVHEYGWRSLNIYASNECGLMATCCPQCGQFHVHSETTLIELLSDDDRPASPGQLGWVVATPLYNYAMPLIRYDHADQAMSPHWHGCERALPALSTVVGKEPVIFEFSGGFRMRPVLPASRVIDYLGALAFQVAQTGEDRCEFRFVPGTMPREQMDFTAMTALLRQQWWQDLKVDYRPMDELPGARTRVKIPIFVREMTAGPD
ncbi:hypothetical protein [Rhodoplanes sp. Z2-YC6860]|uniref:hypothetical protein n=1 Tax=Rhodoplanes sp. Z2-YC6860 TaxID=674703 RepID=UPI00078C2698|nr:hypothetical protein [Rhodoplanes sp. Z2-YC6860]AMN40352.1 Coenzyme A ligase [Rhodoplanes sp. Z2-YC6860]